MNEKMKIVVLDGFAGNPGDLSWAPLEALGQCTVYDRTAPQQVIERAADAQIILTNKVVMSRDVIEALPHLKYIGVIATGYNIIDLDAARGLGIRVGHASYPPAGVADYTVMLMLMALRKAKLVDVASSYQDFGLKGKIGRSLDTCTVGVVGTGAIGEAVCERLAGFGCRIVACDPYPKDRLRGRVEYLELDELLSCADVVTLHAPGLPENEHMIGAEQVARMKDGVVIVNAARGALIDTAALIDAVESGKVGAAALDTIEAEAGLYYLDRSRDVLPNRDRAVLTSFPNVIVTPHMAFYTEEAVEHMIGSNVEALLAFDADGETRFEVK